MRVLSEVSPLCKLFLCAHRLVKPLGIKILLVPLLQTSLQCRNVEYNVIEMCDRVWQGLVFLRQSITRVIVFVAKYMTLRGGYCIFSKLDLLFLQQSLTYSSAAGVLCV